jgi:hypothetical protein
VAAATGHLPGPVREAARSVLGPAGGPTDTSPSPPSAAAPDTGTAGPGGTGSGGSAATTGRGPRTGTAAAGPAAVPALDGLCKAFQEGNGVDRGGKPDAAAFAELIRAAGGADEVAAFCEDLLAGDAKAKTPKDSKPEDPPPDDTGHGQGQGGPPPTTGGGGDQGSPPADPSASNTPAKNDGASDE